MGVHAGARAHREGVGSECASASPPTRFVSQQTPERMAAEVEEWSSECMPQRERAEKVLAVNARARARREGVCRRKRRSVRPLKS